MFWIFQAILIFAVSLEVGLLARACVTGGLKRYTLLYSYVAFVLVADILCASVDHLSPENYANVYWFFVTARTLAEFGVLWGVADCIFKPYPSLRLLGRLWTALATVAFVVFYWRQLGWAPDLSSAHFLNLLKLSALTKSVAIAGILAAARKFRIPLGRNAGGVLLGLVTYYTISVVNFAAALQFGRSIYENVMSWLAPLSYVFCLMIWMVALWKLDPVPAVDGSVDGGMGTRNQAVQIRRLGTTVTRLLWK
jgi:uncharacterized membrane protein